MVPSCSGTGHGHSPGVGGTPGEEAHRAPGHGIGMDMTSTSNAPPMISPSSPRSGAPPRSRGRPRGTPCGRRRLVQVVQHHPHRDPVLVRQTTYERERCSLETPPAAGLTRGANAFSAVFIPRPVGINKRRQRGWAELARKIAVGHEPPVLKRVFLGLQGGLCSSWEPGHLGYPKSGVACASQFEPATPRSDTPSVPTCPATASTGAHEAPECGIPQYGLTCYTAHDVAGDGQIVVAAEAAGRDQRLHQLESMITTARDHPRPDRIDAAPWLVVARWGSWQENGNSRSSSTQRSRRSHLAAPSSQAR